MVCDEQKQELLHQRVCVLILILLEYGLRHSMRCLKETRKSLNPYSIGIWSATAPRELLAVFSAAS